jgi:TetR/AcrR family transcriptional regulator
VSAASEPRRSGAHTREQILDAAERLFATRGYRGTSLEEIGREAGLSRGTPGYFFGSKDRLYAEMLDRIVARTQVSLGSVDDRLQDESLDPRERLSALVAGYVSLLAVEPTLVRLIQWEVLGGHGRILSQMAVHAQGFVGLLQTLKLEYGGPPLSEEAAAEILTAGAALCWFPLAHAEPLHRAFGADPRDPAAVASRAEAIVEFMLWRLGGRAGEGRSTDVAEPPVRTP